MRPNLKPFEISIIFALDNPKARLKYRGAIKDELPAFVSFMTKSGVVTKKEIMDALEA